MLPLLRDIVDPCDIGMDMQQATVDDCFKLQAFPTCSTAKMRNTIVSLVYAMQQAHALVTDPCAGLDLISPSNTQYSSLASGERDVITRSPAMIAVVYNPSQVQMAVQCANQQGLNVVPRSGGHSYLNLSSQNGQMVIDMADMKAVVINQTAGTANVQVGARLGNIYTTIWNNGNWQFNGGTCPSVGIGGFIAGGGYGMTSRKYGLGIDRVKSFNIVIASGTVLSCSATSNSDLFWAVLGGGSGSFGVVTDYTLRLFKEPTNTVFRYEFSTADRAAVIESWMRTYPTVDNRLTCHLDINKWSVVLYGQFLGSMTDFNNVITATGIKNGRNIVSTTVTDQCNGLQTKVFVWANGWQNCLDTSAMNVPARSSNKEYGKFKSDYSSVTFSSSLISNILSRIDTSAGSTWMQLAPMKGQIAAHATNATPFYHRATRFSIQYYRSMSYQEAREPNGAGSTAWSWIRGLETAMKPSVTGGRYQNYPDLDLGSEFGVAYYGLDNFNRLKTIKKARDPGNKFQNEQSIPVV